MSKTVTVTIPHQLGRAEARRRIDEGFADLSRHLGGGAVAKLDKTGAVTLTFAFAPSARRSRGCDCGGPAVTVEVLLPGFLAMIAGSGRAPRRRASCC